VVQSCVDGILTRVLLDCGFSVKELEKRLNVLGLDATQLDAVLITHEHDDHAHGAYRAAKRWRLPLYATYGTLCGAYDATAPDWVDYHSLNYVYGDTAFEVGNLTILPVPVPHDAREPVQYRFSAAGRHLGVLTDLGHTTAHLQQQFSGLHGFVLECNHCPDLLQKSSYPYSLKQRISGDWGHLSNEQAARFLSTIANDSLSQLWCAHLSASNNAPELARNALAQTLQWSDDKVQVLDQAAPGHWFTV
jgi:phosphoribosyl 1,2-cyclic phosphodiesterase